VPLAYLLDDAMKKKAQKWIDWTLDHVQANGMIGPASGAWRQQRDGTEAFSGLVSVDRSPYEVSGLRSWSVDPPDWQVVPEDDWNYALDLSAGTKDSIRVIEREGPAARSPNRVLRST
jgi:hypothetical protein